MPFDAPCRFGSRPFTPAEDAELCKLRAEGWDWDSIAELMGRGSSGAAARARFVKLQLRAAERAEQARRAARFRHRPCLCCGAVFLSEGPHNRLCDSCRQAPD